MNDRSVVLTCHVFGAPKPLVKWLRAGKELTGGRYTVNTTGDLHITNIAYADADVYTCYAVNKFGTVNASATLTVKGIYIYLNMNCLNFSFAILILRFCLLQNVLV